MREKISKEHIRQVLLDINPMVRRYHKNVIKLHTGVDPTNAKILGLKESIDFLRRIWGSCLDWGNQRIDYIGDSVRQLSEFLKSFDSEKEIHDSHVFLEKLEVYPSDKHVTSISLDEVARLTELLQKFHSVRIKTAALIMRFLCLDCNFFEVDISKLIPPLDRVNYRMCSQLFNRRYVLQKLGAYEVSFDKRANFGFADIGKHVLGKNKVLIDNMWFIGHFYHDGHKQNKCEIREGAKVVDYLYLENIIQKMPKLCPFSVHGCERST